MPIIDHSTRPMPEPVEKRSVRSLVTRGDGAESLTITEIVVYPRSEGRLHTHPVDQAIMVTEGSIQMMVGDEIRTVRSGFTLLAPPGVAHNLVNNTWVAAKMLVICPVADLETSYLE